MKKHQKSGPTSNINTGKILSLFSSVLKAINLGGDNSFCNWTRNKLNIKLTWCLAHDWSMSANHWLTFVTWETWCKNIDKFNRKSKLIKENQHKMSQFNVAAGKKLWSSSPVWKKTTWKTMPLLNLHEPSLLEIQFPDLELERDWGFTRGFQ